MKLRPGEKIHIQSLEELLGIVNEESALDIEIEKIEGFANHPFKVVDDDKMTELINSIKINGVLSPVLIRPKGKDTYEMISGHRRLHAAVQAGLKSIPSIIRDLNDDEAVIAMVDANIQREELLPSEKAFAYKMKLKAMNRQGQRNDLTSSQNGTKKLRSDQLLAEQCGESKNTIHRYVRLTELIPELLDYVDKKRLQFTVAVDISYIDKDIQSWLYEYIKENGTVKARQIALLREACASGPVSQARLISILNESQPGRKTNSSNIISEQKLREYFPPDYSAADMEQVILELLEKWKGTGYEL